MIFDKIMDRARELYRKKTGEPLYTDRTIDSIIRAISEVIEDSLTKGSNGQGTGNSDPASER